MGPSIRFVKSGILLCMVSTLSYSQYFDLTDDKFAIDTIPAQRSSDLFIQFQSLPNRGAESSAMGDFNNDGIMDIATHNIWYAGPDFTETHLFRGNNVGDYDDTMIALDVNGDGWLDISVAGHYEGLIVYLNPGAMGSTWAMEVVDDGYNAGDCWNGTHGWLKSAVNYHSGTLLDVNGDGVKAELVTSGACHPQYWLEVAGGKWVSHKVSTGTTQHQWGSGAGDINGDGRPDIIRPDAWYEAPEDPRNGKWVFHPVTLFPIERKGPETPDYAHFDTSQHSDNMFAYDVNADGLNDILSSSSHGWGIFWYEQYMDNAGSRTFVRHTIDETVDNGHTLEFEDMDSDGDPDLVVGRRVRIDDGDPPIPLDYVYWYELKPGEENPWVRHVISFDDGIATGTKPGIQDIDGDGDLDFVTNSYKGGPYLFINQTDHGPPVSVSKRIQAPKYQPKLKAVFHGGGIYLLGPGNKLVSGLDNNMIRRDLLGKKQTLILK